MSENMQRPKSKNYQGARSSDGSTRLNTSCSECHRRKQKCDQMQPCRHCARRYPPPPCLYQSSKPIDFRNIPSFDGEITDTTNTHAERIAEEGQVDILLPNPVDFSNWETAFPSPSCPYDFQYGAWRSQGSGDCSASAAINFLPGEELDSFEPVSAYQRLLTVMVSSPYEDVNQVNTDFNLINGENGHDSLIFREENAIAFQRLRWECSTANGVAAPSRFSINSVDPLHYLPITPSIQNTELFNIFLKVITKYVVSIDGFPSPNYYNDKWIPWAIKSPLLAQVGIYTAACYRSEFQKVPAGKSPVALSFKAKSIEMLNEMLQSQEHSTCDETIAAVVYLITNEWYWGGNENVKAHLNGLREIITLRGGMEKNMNPFLRQMVILCDYHIACSFDCEPMFLHEIEDQVNHQVGMGSPFFQSNEQFTTHSQTLKINNETAIILDDLRFLTTSIIKLSRIDPLDQGLVW